MNGQYGAYRVLAEDRSVNVGLNQLALVSLWVICGLALSLVGLQVLGASFAEGLPMLG